MLVEHWECVRRDGSLIFTFDAEKGFAPSGNLTSASVDPANGILDLVWSNGCKARLPDAGQQMAWMIARAPHIDVRWVADDMLMGAELVR